MASVVSRNEIDFALKALRNENVRIDGRALPAYRRFGVKFGAAHGEVEVNFGPTRAMAVCSGEIIAPMPDRPNEGRITFHVEYGSIASPGFENMRPSAQSVAVANFIERLLKGSKAVDAEALCIVGGQKVWSIRVDVRALDDDGNLGDACAIAALCALLHFRKADVEVKGDQMRAYTEQERVPVPLSIHHIPVPVTFALFEREGKPDDPLWLLDPNRLEEAAMGGSICVALNQHGELCAINKPGGMPINFELINTCTELATSKVKEHIAFIQAQLTIDLEQRKQNRRNVHQLYDMSQLLTVNLDGSDPAPPVAAPAAAPAPPSPDAAEEVSEQPQEAAKAGKKGRKRRKVAAK